MAKLQGDNLPSYILSFSRWVSIIRIGVAIVLAGCAAFSYRYPPSPGCSRQDGALRRSSSLKAGRSHQRSGPGSLG
jgi:hypothetical protein